MNPFELLKNLPQMQQKFAEAQSKMQNIRAEGNSAGGMVKVIMDGKFMPISIQIDSSLLQPNDKEVVEDLVLAAMRDAHNKVQETIKGEFMGMGMPFPGMGM